MLTLCTAGIKISLCSRLYVRLLKHAMPALWNSRSTCVGLEPVNKIAAAKATFTMAKRFFFGWLCQLKRWPSWHVDVTTAREPKTCKSKRTHLNSTLHVAKCSSTAIVMLLQHPGKLIGYLVMELSHMLFRNLQKA